MDQQTQQLMAKVAQYIQYTQPQLDKAAELRSALKDYRAKMAEAIDKMAEKNLIPMQERVALYDNLAAHPEKAAELLCRLSDRVSSNDAYSLGGPSDRLKHAESADALVRFVLGDS